MKKGKLLDLVWRAGASVTKTAELLGFSRVTILRTMKEFEMHGKTSSNRSNSGQTSKHTGRGGRALKCIVGKDHGTTAAKVTDELIQHLNSPVSIKTVLR